MVKKTKIMLDSGAFSAWNRGAIINIDDYITFCLANLDIVDYIVNLDVIPGKPFKRPTKQQITNSAEKGWENYQKMLAAGIPKNKLIHVFHQGEDFEWLQKIAKHVPYIGISPANDKTTAQKISWLDDCMKYVLDEHGKPIVKFHGFAVTSLKVVFRYPWYSVDSSAWQLISGGFGKIFTPAMVGDKNKPDYWHNIQTAIGTGVASYAKTENNTGFFDSMERRTQSQVSFLDKQYKCKIEKLLSEYGFSLPEMEENMHERSSWNAIYLITVINRFSTVKLFLACGSVRPLRFLRKRMKGLGMDTNDVNVLSSYALMPKTNRGGRMNLLQKIKHLFNLK